MSVSQTKRKKELFHLKAGEKRPAPLPLDLCRPESEASVKFHRIQGAAGSSEIERY